MSVCEWIALRLVRIMKMRFVNKISKFRDIFTKYLSLKKM